MVQHPIRQKERAAHMDWINYELRSQNQLNIIHLNYIGIDFGTSTSVVSRVVLTNNQAQIEPVYLDQPEEYGGVARHYLVNSVLAWRNKKLLWGQDAYRLKPVLTEGVNLFSSFKMKLGLSIGPTYPNTMLSLVRGQDVVIETAEDATYWFFDQLINALKQEIGINDLSEYRFAFSVPASFEANQRRALLESLAKNNIKEEQCCLIDEPNAAFLSFLHQCFTENEYQKLLSKLKSQSCNLLVYDFGAGTCDISILKIAIEKNKISSRNLAISKFTALGGDDIDCAIARLLAKQMMDDHEALSSRDVDEFLIPKLQATAERLKISVNNWLSKHNISCLKDCYRQDNVKFEDLPLSIKVKEQELTSHGRVYLYLHDFVEIMEGFLGEYDESYTVKHIMSPVYDAMRKAALVAEDLDAVLFIGGSSKSSLVQSCVKQELTQYGEQIEFIIPKDLQSHVSLGAAIHSLSYFGFGLDLIQPIISETIYIITQNDSLTPVIPASSLVPSEQPFLLELVVKNNQQDLIELPLCVGNKNKLLGILSIKNDDEFFHKGDRVQVKAQINHEKLLLVETVVNNQIASTKILNPLANQELTTNEIKLLKVKQEFNQAILDNKGRPPVHIVSKYAKALQEAGEFEKAADMYVALERIESGSDYATQICYLYDRAGQRKESNHWGKVAYKRNPCDITAYNVACGTFDQNEKIKYLRESLRHNPGYISALIMLGRILYRQGDCEGRQLLERAQDQLQNQWIQNERDLENLVEVSDLLGDRAAKEQAEQQLKNYQQDQQDNDLPYSQDNLLGGLNLPSIKGG